MDKKTRPYELLKFYQNICSIRLFIAKITKRFERGNYRLISQMRDAARSAKQNIREGYRKGSINEFIHYIKISRGSLEELSGDIEDCKEDSLVSDDEYAYFYDLYQRTDYMIGKYLESLYKMKREGTWKVPGDLHRRTKDMQK